MGGKTPQLIRQQNPLGFGRRGLLPTGFDHTRLQQPIDRFSGLDRL